MAWPFIRGFRPCHPVLGQQSSIINLHLPADMRLIRHPEDLVDGEIVPSLKLGKGSI